MESNDKRGLITQRRHTPRLGPSPSGRRALAGAGWRRGRHGFLMLTVHMSHIMYDEAYGAAGPHVSCEEKGAAGPAAPHGMGGPVARHMLRATLHHALPPPPPPPPPLLRTAAALDAEGCRESAAANCAMPDM